MKRVWKRCANEYVVESSVNCSGVAISSVLAYIHTSVRCRRYSAELCVRRFCTDSFVGLIPVLIILITPAIMMLMTTILLSIISFVLLIWLVKVINQSLWLMVWIPLIILPSHWRLSVALVRQHWQLSKYDGTVLTCSFISLNVYSCWHLWIYQSMPFFVLKETVLSITALVVAGTGRAEIKQTDKQTDRQKTQCFWLPRRRVKSEPHQTWHGDRGPRARSFTSKTFGGLTHSFAAKGRWKFGGNPTPST